MDRLCRIHFAWNLFDQDSVADFRVPKQTAAVSIGRGLFPYEIFHMRHRIFFGNLPHLVFHIGLRA